MITSIVDNHGIARIFDYIKNIHFFEVFKVELDIIHIISSELVVDKLQGQQIINKLRFTTKRISCG